VSSQSADGVCNLKVGRLNSINSVVNGESILLKSDPVAIFVKDIMVVHITGVAKYL
jgi:hypothetical protein